MNIQTEWLRLFVRDLSKEIETYNNAYHERNSLLEQEVNILNEIKKQYEEISKINEKYLIDYTYDESIYVWRLIEDKLFVEQDDSLID